MMALAYKSSEKAESVVTQLSSFHKEEIYVKFN